MHMISRFVIGTPLQTLGQPLPRSVFGKQSVGKTEKGGEITKIAVIVPDINRSTRLYHFRLGGR